MTLRINQPNSHILSGSTQVSAPSEATDEAAVETTSRKTATPPALTAEDTIHFSRNTASTDDNMKRAPVKHQQNKLIVMLLAGVGVALGGLGLLKHHTNQEAELMRKEVARLTKEQELAVKAAAEAATTRTSQVIGTGVPLRTTITTTTSTRTTRGSSNEAYQKRATEETRRREAEAARQRAAKAAMEELRRRVAEAERQRAAETAARGASSKANPAQKIAEAKAISEKAAAEKVQGTPFTAEAIAEREQSFNKFKKLLNTVTNDDYREFNRGRIIDHMREKGFNNWADLLKEHPGADFPGY